jgi:hypothetical protein
MASEEHLQIIRQGVDAWNEWRKKNPKLIPDLSGTDLSFASLSGANFSWANLGGVNLSGANLSGANFYEAHLITAHLDGANLSGADLSATRLGGANLGGANLAGATLDWADNLGGAQLSGALLVRTNLCGATLSESYVYGAAVWDIKVNDRTKQQNLVITPYGEEAITVDNIKVAQFIYLLLNNEEIRDVIDTITSKAVLILGRFSEDRKPVLDALRDALRNKGFLPIVFDFERPQGRDFTETVKVLAGLSCFVIVDITNPRSAPLELQATVPEYMIPFVPILQEGEQAFAMFVDLQAKHDWVLGTLLYDSCENLIKVLDDAVINPALEKRHELEVTKVQVTPARRVSDYRKH